MWTVTAQTNDGLGCRHCNAGRIEGPSNGLLRSKPNSTKDGRNSQHDVLQPTERPLWPFGWFQTDFCSCLCQTIFSSSCTETDHFTLWVAGELLRRHGTCTNCEQSRFVLWSVYSAPCRICSTLLGNLINTNNRWHVFIILADSHRSSQRQWSTLCPSKSALLGEKRWTGEEKQFKSCIFLDICGGSELKQRTLVFQVCGTSILTSRDQTVDEEKRITAIKQCIENDIHQAVLNQAPTEQEAVDAIV